MYDRGKAHQWGRSPAEKGGNLPCLPAYPVEVSRQPAELTKKWGAQVEVGERRRVPGSDGSGGRVQGGRLLLLLLVVGCWGGLLL